MILEAQKPAFENGGIWDSVSFELAFDKCVELWSGAAAPGCYITPAEYASICIHCQLPMLDHMPAWI